jgi:hypothetical protein
MPPPGIERIQQSFNNYRIEDGITADGSKDYARIEFFSGKVKVGRALFGDMFGRVTNVDPDGQIQVWFPFTQFATVLSLLQTQRRLLLFVDFDLGPPRVLLSGGIAARGPRKKR